MRIDTSGQAASNFIWRMPPISYEFLFMTMAAGSIRNFCVPAERDNWGLSGMRERAEKIGAKVKVLSRPHGGGTEVELRVPSDIAFGTRSPNLASHWFKDRYRRHKEYESRSK